MKQKILEVQNYFADKLARGLYKIVKIDQYTVDVIVDRKYLFCLWASNNPSSFKVYNFSDNFMDVKFTEKQKESGYKIANKYVKRWVDTELRDKELTELNRLKEKYPETK